MLLALAGLTAGTGQDALKDALTHVVDADPPLDDLTAVDVNVVFLALKKGVVGG